MSDGQQRRPTSTSSFGVSRRENHDASAFYDRFTQPVLSKSTDVAEHRDIDDIFVGDSSAMDKVDDNSVALVVTSPPYFAGKEYEVALGEGHVPATYAEYLAMLTDVFAECVRTLEPGGRIAVNVANLGRKPYRSLSADITSILQDELRLLLRGEVIWLKSRGAAGSCAWGSFQRPANPVLRDLTERVVIASKGRFDRAITPKERHGHLPSEASIFRDEFMEATTDVWEIPPESASRVGHPAPFPVELPERLIHLYTYRGDLVLDPFMGSGTTAVAAVRTDRHFVGYDTDPEYVERALGRVADERARLADHEASAARPLQVRLPGRPTAATDDAPGDDAGSGTASAAGEVEAFLAKAIRDGLAARDLAKLAVEHAGFDKVRTKVPPRHGAEITLRAVDAGGDEWLFDVSGGFTSNRSGLRRSEALWKTLGKAAVLHAADPDVRLVLLTTDAPAPNSAAGKALQLVRDQGAIRDVIVLTSPEDVARLAAHAHGESPDAG
ncbi:MAG: site-specific DNA-methyltransferase [Actinomycetota bacterium]|nr:site-specific DNA-methyltransferase [Actinomycetota bacterium]